MNLTNHYTGEDHPQFKHGWCHTSEYETWKSMRQRCTNPNAHNYHLYGGRGIKICARWMESFENFLADVGARPSDRHSVDRWPNKNGNYEPGNVRWATAREQQNNVRSNHMVIYKDREMSFADALRLAGSVVRRDTAERRLLAGWSLEEALETPVGVRTRWKQKSPHF